MLPAAAIVFTGMCTDVPTGTVQHSTAAMCVLCSGLQCTASSACEGAQFAVPHMYSIRLTLSCYS